MIRSVETQYAVIVTYRSDMASHGRLEQAFNCDTLDHVWARVNDFKRKPSVRRIRVMAQLAVFEITQD